MPSKNAAKVAKTLSCGSRLLNDRPSAISAAACSWMLISNRWSRVTRPAALPSFVDGSRSHDTKKQLAGCFFATAS